jgi:hypothetical protein
MIANRSLLLIALALLLTGAAHPLPSDPAGVNALDKAGLAEQTRQQHPARETAPFDFKVIPGTQAAFDRLQPLITGLSGAQTVAILALHFLGTPYAAFSLDADRQERVQLDLTRFDCMLFVEQLLALAASQTWNGFAEVTRQLRYANGEVGYCSRHHYFHYWGRSAEAAGLVDDITRDLPGQQSRVLKLNYMSSHPELYDPLRNQSTLACITRLEQVYDVVQTYIPNSSLNRVSSLLRSGDLFAVATSIRGLDVTHMGVIVNDDSGVSAVHAVPGQGVIRSKSFHRYVQSVPESIGAVILRTRSVLQTGVGQEQPGT